MKRQQSSSSGRQKSPESHTIGCMSGLFHLLSRYQKRRKFLTFGKKHEKSSTSGSGSGSGSGAVVCPPKKNKGGSDEMRSPRLAAEIRRCSPVLGQESTVEKRRKLMGALERCDRDLKALKKIIEDVHSRFQSSNGEQQLIPSPVSVLHLATTSPSPLPWTSSHATSAPEKHAGAGAEGVVKQQQQQQQQKKRAEEEMMIKLSLVDRMTSGSCLQSRSSGDEALLSRRAMVESVNEACNDVAWGHKRELARIALALQDLIFTDLLHDLLNQIIITPNPNPNPNHNRRKTSQHCAYTSLPFQACKRKLRF